MICFASYVLYLMAVKNRIDLFTTITKRDIEKMTKKEIRKVCILMSIILLYTIIGFAVFTINPSIKINSFLSTVICILSIGLIFSISVYIMWFIHFKKR
ncbi:hypothetical protein [Paraclostridium sordellii]|uniref:hypothetical protein n=1 Tax=Paraclostridium sordellii TaxID=1505 RepID=UPI00070A6254|nr:hypothetical protein [Paeniclostridium sordellii]